MISSPWAWAISIYLVVGLCVARYVYNEALLEYQSVGMRSIKHPEIEVRPSNILKAALIFGILWLPLVFAGLAVLLYQLVTGKHRQ